MRVFTKETTARLMALEPTELGAVTNQLGQRVRLLEHPTHGDEAPVLAFIDGVLANTDAYDTEDFYSGSEYNPCLVGRKVSCAFELNVA